MCCSHSFLNQERLLTWGDNLHIKGFCCGQHVRIGRGARDGSHSNGEVRTRGRRALWNDGIAIAVSGENGTRVVEYLGIRAACTWSGKGVFWDKQRWRHLREWDLECAKIQP